MSQYVVEDEDLTLDGRQSPQRRTHRQPLFNCRIRPDRMMTRVSGTRLRPSAAFSAAIQTGIHHDATEPRKRRRVAAEPVSPAQRPKKRLLHHVFSFVADVARGHSTQLPLRPFVQVYHRVLQGTL